jgi:phosphoglycolate phosphatase
MKPGILFDLDGTLLDTLDDLYDAVNFVLQQLGHPKRTKAEVRHFVGNGARRLIEQALPEKHTEEELNKGLEIFHEYYNSLCDGGTTCPFPGISQVLEQLKKQYPVAVVSNKPDAAVKILCEKYFPGVTALGVTEQIARKPAPDMVFAVMKQMGVDRCVYVGDSEVDVLTAKNAGVPCVSVLWGFRDKWEIEEAGGKIFCEKTEELPDIIASLTK